MLCKLSAPMKMWLKYFLQIKQRELGLKPMCFIFSYLYCCAVIYDQIVKAKAHKNPAVYILFGDFFIHVSCSLLAYKAALSVPLATHTVIRTAVWTSCNIQKAPFQALANIYFLLHIQKCMYSSNPLIPHIVWCCTY